jgi:type II secretory pathway pseudopilin PulG
MCKKGVSMKYVIVFLLSLSLLLTLNSCKRKGTFTDIAKKKQASRAIKYIRNALEEYYLDHNSYPPDGACLKDVLAPYMKRVVTSSGDSVSRWEKEIEPAFSDGPYYSTEDPKKNFFVKARAGDLNKTLISIRPSIIREDEEEKKKEK